MGSRVKQTLLLILTILISAALCYTHDGPTASESALKSFPENGEGTPALKFLYTVEDPETKIPCTMANMSISIALNYTTKKHTVVRKQMKIPSDAVVRGTCKPMVSEMSLVWTTREDDRDQQNVVKFVLFNDRTNFSVFSVDVDLFLDTASFPDAADERRTTRSKIDLGLFDAPVENGMHNCPMERRIKVDNDTTLITSKVSFIAFNTRKDYGQREEIICDDNTNTKVFPVAYEDKYTPGVLLLSRISFTIEIPYLTIHNTIAKYTVKNLIKPMMVFGYIDRVPSDDTLNGYLSLYFDTEKIESRALFHIYVYFLQDVSGIAYVSGVDLTYHVAKENLPDAKHGVYRQLKRRFRLFPAPSDSGIFSCSKGTTLNLDDVRLQMTDVLLVMFDTTRDFSSKQVIDCNSQPRLTMNDFNYALEEKNGAVPCILANMTISMRILYEQNKMEPARPQNNRQLLAYTYITVPANAKVSGFCGDSVSKMELTWPAEDEQLNSVALYLSRDINFSVFHVETDIYIDNTSFPNIRDKYIGQWERHRSNTSLHMFVGPKDNGWYICPGRQEIIRGDETTITISNVSLIAFNEQEDLNTKETFSCLKDEEKLRPHPSEADFEYVVRDQDKNIACILANMSISVKATYTTTSNRNAETTFVVPKEIVTVTGNCNCRNPELTLEWQTDPEKHYKSSITLTFGGDRLSYQLNEILVKFDYDEKNFPNASEWGFSDTKRNLDLFSGYIGSIYKCDTETVVDLRDVQLTFTNVSVTAFNHYRDVSDLLTTNCYVEPPSPYISIPIILSSILGGLLVGCALGGLAFVCKKYYKKY